MTKDEFKQGGSTGDKRLITPHLGCLTETDRSYAGFWVTKSIRRRCEPAFR